jgi:hypothetical protein
LQFKIAFTNAGGNNLQLKIALFDAGEPYFQFKIALIGAGGGNQQMKIALFDAGQQVLK